MYFWDN